MRVAALVLVAALLIGCGSDEGDDYCSTLRSDNTALNELADAAQERDADYLVEALAIFERIREVAPDDLRDEWDTVVFAWSDLVDSLEQAGIDAGTFDPGKRPEGVSPEVFRNVKDVAAELSSVRVLDAVRVINEQARNACELSLDL